MKKPPQKVIPDLDRHFNSSVTRDTAGDTR